MTLKGKIEVTAPFPKLVFGDDPLGSGTEPTQYLSWMNRDLECSPQNYSLGATGVVQSLHPFKAVKVLLL